jgi:hypothetical protein
MGHPRADLSRRGRCLLWCDRHPYLSHAAVVACGWVYLWALVGLTVTP